MNQDFYKKVANGTIELILYIYQRPHLRDPQLEYELHMGLNILNNIFEPDPKVDEKTTEIFLSFPERWMNIVEERSLYNRLGIYYPNLRNVAIKTQSPQIIGETYRECCRIVGSPDGTDLPSSTGKGILYLPMTGNVFKAGLNVLGG